LVARKNTSLEFPVFLSATHTSLPGEKFQYAEVLAAHIPAVCRSPRRESRLETVPNPSPSPESPRNLHAFNLLLFRSAGPAAHAPCFTAHSKKSLRRIFPPEVFAFCLFMMWLPAPPTQIGVGQSPASEQAPHPWSVQPGRRRVRRSLLLRFALQRRRSRLPYPELVEAQICIERYARENFPSRASAAAKIDRSQPGFFQTHTLQECPRNITPTSGTHRSNLQASILPPSPSFSWRRLFTTCQLECRCLTRRPIAK